MWLIAGVGVQSGGAINIEATAKLVITASSSLFEDCVAKTVCSHGFMLLPHVRTASSFVLVGHRLAAQ